MTLEANRALIHRLFDEVLNGDDTDVLDEIVSAEYVEHAALAEQQDTVGVEGVKQHVAIFRGAFPDMRWDLEDLVAEGEKVVARWRMDATNAGEFMGKAPTGKKVATSGIDVYRIVDGLTEHWHEMDTLGLMQQLGIDSCVGVALPHLLDAEEAASPLRHPSVSDSEPHGSTFR